MEHHVIILGCGRSGTSIFGEFFDHLNPYQHISEPPFSQLMGMDFSNPVAVKVPTESEEYPPTKGLSFPLETLLSTIPDPKTIFWQVRHPLDTICSLKVGIAKNWGHHPKPTDWKDWLNKPLIKQCAHHWNYINSIGFEPVKDIVHITRFEDMVANPTFFANQLTKKLNIDNDVNRDEIASWIQRVQNTNNSSFKEAKTSRPYSTADHKVKIGRWKENLTDSEVNDAIPIVMETAKRFGYNLP